MFNTLRTLFRAEAAEAEEALISRNAVTLLAQHLRDAREENARSRAAIARLMVRETARTRLLDTLTADILRREREAKLAFEKGEEALAGEIANTIMALEDKKVAEEAARSALSARIEAARMRLDENEARVRDLAEELRVAREASLSRTPALVGAPTASALDRAIETAATLKARDTGLADLEDAYRRMEDEKPEASLDARIAAAGLDTTRNERREALMNRLKSTGEKS